MRAKFSELSYTGAAPKCCAQAGGEKEPWLTAEQIPVMDITVGKRIWLANSEDGSPMPATVLEIDGEGVVTFDLNHPLAGKALNFEVELIEIEDAPEDFVSAAEKAAHMKEQSKLLGGVQGDDFR